MFMIKEKLEKEPIRLPVDPLVKSFVPGQVAQIDYDRMVCGISDGSRPFGLIDDYRDDEVDSTKLDGLITVWTQRIIFKTDIYDKTSWQYEAGEALYVKEGGILTNLPPSEDSILVGRIISVFEGIKPGSLILEGLWL